MTKLEPSATANGGAADDPSKIWHKTACVLCSCNCGVEVRLDGRDITRVKGNKAHVGSKGYTCEKALRLDHYQKMAMDNGILKRRAINIGKYDTAEALEWGVTGAGLRATGLDTSVASASISARGLSPKVSPSSSYSSSERENSVSKLTT